MAYDTLQLAARAPSGTCRPPGDQYRCVQEPPAFPLISEEAADVLGISLRELFYVLARFAHIPGIVEKHGRKNLFYRENIELIRHLRRKQAADKARLANNSANTAVHEKYQQIVAGLRKNRKGGGHV